MMVTTHLLAGLVLALPVVIYAPELALPAVLGTALGSVLPDLDLYFGHRKTLHYPQYALWAVPPATFVALASLHPGAIALAFAVFGMALHVRMDVYGGGLELRPWEARSDRAVYDHVNGRWVAPRRLVRFDGAPEDVAIASLLAIPSLVVFDGPIRWGVVAILAVSIAYGVVRKPLVDLGVVLLRWAPAPLLGVLPRRYLEEELSDRL